MGGELFDPEACRTLSQALALLWREAPHAVLGARTPASVAGGLIWVVGKANDLFGGGVTQQLVQRELWLKQPLNTAGQGLARHLRGIDFHGTPRPHGCPDLMSFASPELLTAGTRRTLIAWRDLALAQHRAAPD